MGIEPTFSAWEADVLPLNYTREGMDRKVARNPSPARFIQADSERSPLVGLERLGPDEPSEAPEPVRDRPSRCRPTGVGQAARSERAVWPGGRYSPTNRPMSPPVRRCQASSAVEATSTW
jgi:hypothetical protein